MFVVLSDDQFRQQLQHFNSKPKPQDAAAAAQAPSEPVVPQPSGTSGTGSGSHPNKPVRNPKRGATVALGSSAKK